MRYAIVSDLHANLQAWNAVLADIRAREIDRIICLGDIVGYGPKPAEVLASTYRHVHCFVLGNHDAVVGGLLAPYCFNDEAQRMIRWTQDQLHGRATTFFQNVPLVVKGPRFRCGHSEFSSPNSFNYLDAEFAALSWQAAPEPLMFVGHTHVPEIHILDGVEQKCRDAVGFYLEDGKRYIVNVGSVGLPRDDDFRASYCIYDESDTSVAFKRVAYDMDAFAADVQTAFGSSLQSDYLLSLYKDGDEPLREVIDFSPVGDDALKGVTVEQELEQLMRKTRRWQFVAIAAVVAALVIVGLGAWYWQAQPKAQTRTGPPAAEVILHPDWGMRPLSFIPKQGTTVGQLPPGWEASFSDIRHQSIVVQDEALLLASLQPEQKLEVTLPRVELGTFRKLQWHVDGVLDEFTAGELPYLTVNYFVEQELLRGESFALNRKDTKVYKQKTLEIPKKVTAVQARIHLNFQGRLRLQRLSVIPK